MSRLMSTKDVISGIANPEGTEEGSPQCEGGRGFVSSS
jgi:hypothetical protein